MSSDITQGPVLVIGAGMAGLSCARMLHKAGRRVSVVDKSRGLGGRMSTRRGEDWQADHGAQYFTARDADFLHEVARWQTAGVAAPWQPRVTVIGARRSGEKMPEPPLRPGGRRLVERPTTGAAHAAFLDACGIILPSHTLIQTEISGCQPAVKPRLTSAIT